jgi:hypothetical protein
MGTSVYITIVVVGFLVLVSYSILDVEKRKSERRQYVLPYPIERRKLDRGRRSIYSYLAWALRSQGSKLIK